LVWLLCFRNRSLRLDFLGLSRREAIRAAVKLVQHQLGLGNGIPVLDLPVYGNLCLPVHRGYRAFDFHRDTVARVFSSDVDSAIVSAEIEGVRTAGQLDFAPTVRRWDVEERWYEEDFVIGCPGRIMSRSEPAALLETYLLDVAPCIERLILLQAPVVKGLGEYVDEVMEGLEDGRLSRPELDARKVDLIRRFVSSTSDRLYLEGDRRIDLVFSHGDFSLVNILKTRDGIAVIDWESAGRRSTLFDLYNYFLTELYYERVSTNLVPEINEAISSLQSNLAFKSPRIAQSLSLLAQTYRRLYYLERVLLLLERELSDKLLDVVQRSIDVFSRYEEATVSTDLAIRE
jgi:hypothetical protein